MRLDNEKLTIVKLLRLDSQLTSPSGQLLVPPYQRAYCWDEDLCETLWRDINEFLAQSVDPGDPTRELRDEYFVGTIVTCANAQDAGTLDIIDGQQRLTTFMLLLRAILRHYECRPPEELSTADRDWQRDLASCLWYKNNRTGVVERGPGAAIKLRSEVAFESQRSDLERILCEGPAPTDAPKRGPDNRSELLRNYSLFCRLVDQFQANAQYRLSDLCLAVEHCVVLLIRCDDLDAALTIFNTLNNRGQPLEDADIFKAELYRRLPEGPDKARFAAEWKDMQRRLDTVRLSATDIFRDYMFHLRGTARDNEVALRQFYQGADPAQRFASFEQPGFFGNIKETADLWVTLLENADTFRNNPLLTPQAAKWLHCLTLYSNIYWRFPITVYYFAHRQHALAVREGGETEGLAHIDSPAAFERFLARLTAFLYGAFLRLGTVNAIQPLTYELCAALARGYEADIDSVLESQCQHDFNEPLNEAFLRNRRHQKALLLLDAYLSTPAQRLVGRNQHLEVERIFPRRYDPRTYPPAQRVDERHLVEAAGNKTLLARPLNIVAREGYFAAKREAYTTSALLATRNLANQHGPGDFDAYDIERRSQQMLNRLNGFLQGQMPETSSQPTSTPPPIDNQYHLEVRRPDGVTIRANAHIGPGGLVVEAGSTIAATALDNIPEVCTSRRQTAPVDENSRLTMPQTFPNGTQAAIVVTGMRKARCPMWKDPDGQPLKSGKLP